MDAGSGSETETVAPPQEATIADVRVVRRREGATVEVAVHGEADAATADELRAGLLAALEPGTTVVVVDLAGLSFCCLAGTDALHDFVTEAASRGVRVELRGMSPLLTWLYREFHPRPTHVLGAPPVERHPPRWETPTRPGS